MKEEGEKKGGREVNRRKRKGEGEEAGEEERRHEA